MPLKDLELKLSTAEDEYAKNPDLKKESIEELRQWVKVQPELPDVIDEKFLILFYHSCHYDMAATKQCIEVYYQLRLNTPEFFNNRSMKTPEMKKSLEALYYGILPVKDPNGNQIIFHGLQQYEPSKYVFGEGVKLLTMAAEACLVVEGTLPGFIFLFDMKGVRLGHLTRLSLSLLRKFFLYIQDGVPLRLKAIHVVNTLPIIDKVMFMIKPFMKKELLKLIHFHSSDFSEVQQYLPKNCLPSDFDGELPSIHELHGQFVEWMTKLDRYFIEDQRYRDEIIDSKKSLKKSPVSGLEPGLGGLEID